MTMAKYKYGNENNTVSAKLQDYHDGEGGYDILTIDGGESTGGLFFSKQVEWGMVYVYWNKSGYHLSLGSLDYVMKAELVGEQYQSYHETKKTFVSFKNFEAVNVLGSGFNDFIAYQNGTEYHGREGTDTFYANWSDWTDQITWINNGGTVTLGSSKINISGMESLFLYLGKGNDVLDNSAFSAPTQIDAGEGDDQITTGAGNDFLEGGPGNDTLRGGAGNDEFFGSEGNNMLYGGPGNDIFWVLQPGDHVIEYADEGIDKVRTYLPETDLRNYANVEELEYWGADSAILHGNELDNHIRGSMLRDTLYGYEGNDILNGGGGSDIMIGGKGNDTYIVDYTYDYITERHDEGEDTIYTTVKETDMKRYHNVENLEYHGEEDAIVKGNIFNNRIFGNDGNDTLSGLDGDDQLYGHNGDDILEGGNGMDKLYGGSGADTMIGGAGDDLYEVNDLNDKIIEENNEGVDTVHTSVNYVLTDAVFVENAVLQGVDDLNFTGNGLDNDITGNSGNNHILGGAGNDRIRGGAGNDILEGGAGHDALNGNAGADRMLGGTGDDAYFVDNINDKVIEKNGEGLDTVYTSVNYALTGTFVENAVLQGKGNINFTGNTLHNDITGNSGNNHIWGGAGNDKIRGGAGNDILEGGAGHDALNGNAGADRMLGGLGNDAYFVDNVKDKVIEKNGEGTDTVYSTVNYALTGTFVENAVLQGKGNLNLTGNTLHNTLTGNAGNNVLNGGKGNDTLIGGAGKDNLTGGAGKDVFKYGHINDSTLSLKDVITDFTRGQDKIDLSAIDANAKLSGNQAFSFIGAANFSAAGQLRYAGGVLYGEVNGDGRADFAIDVKNVTRLQASDFIL